MEKTTPIELLNQIDEDGRAFQAKLTSLHFIPKGKDDANVAFVPKEALKKEEKIIPSFDPNDIKQKLNPETLEKLNTEVEKEVKHPNIETEKEKVSLDTNIEPKKTENLGAQEIVIQEKKEPIEGEAPKKEEEKKELLVGETTGKVDILQKSGEIVGKVGSTITETQTGLANAEGAVKLLGGKQGEDLIIQTKDKLGSVMTFFFPFLFLAIIIIVLILFNYVFLILGGIMGIGMLLRNNPGSKGWPKKFMYLHGFFGGGWYLIYSGFKYGWGYTFMTKK